MKNKKMERRAERKFWLLVSIIVILGCALAAAWYVYVPDVPATEQGHRRR
jgi:ABC-type transporter Mla subunit MlaD